MLVHGDNQCQILIMIFSCSVLSLNLHNCCANVIMMEFLHNLNKGFQAIGWLYHLLKLSASGTATWLPQKVFILYQEHSIACYLDYFNTKKALPQIATVINDRIQVGIESARVGVQDQVENGGHAK